MERLLHVLKWEKENPPALQPLVVQHRNKIRAKARAYVTKRRKKDLNFRMTANLRGRLGSAMRSFGFKKYARTIHLLGCTVVELKRHLETLWQPGMCWENYGEWHIDHKKPCAAFDLLNPEQQRACFHYTNLQPLWAADNFRKGDTYAVCT